MSQPALAISILFFLFFFFLIFSLKQKNCHKDNIFLDTYFFLHVFAVSPWCQCHISSALPKGHCKRVRSIKHPDISLWAISILFHRWFKSVLDLKLKRVKLFSSHHFPVGTSLHQIHKPNSLVGRSLSMFLQAQINCCS